MENFQHDLVESCVNVVMTVGAHCELLKVAMFLV